MDGLLVKVVEVGRVEGFVGIDWVPCIVETPFYQTDPGRPGEDVDRAVTGTLGNKDQFPGLVQWKFTGVDDADLIVNDGGWCLEEVAKGREIEEFLLSVDEPSRVSTHFQELLIPAGYLHAQ